ncbi:hypothetical protein [Chryseobacterium sp. JK1]|uniref:hypothetical protein n=1 Tax=Chryseobacterium sp. JK1 TaxID=874294 RepID=UPI003D699FD3
MKKLLNILLFYYFSGTVLACAGRTGTEYTYENIKRIVPGMSFKKVITLMGKEYEVLDRKVEKLEIGYRTADRAVYRISFKENIVIKIHKENPEIIIDLKK